MKTIAIGIFLTFTLSLLHAQTPFTLTGIKRLSVIAEDYSGLKLEKAFIESLESMMAKSLKDLGVTVEKYNNNILALMIKSQTYGKVKLVTLDMFLAGQVLRSDEKESVFGLTYRKSDTVEIDDLKTDIVDSLEFLLSEFNEQYKEDQKE